MAHPNEEIARRAFEAYVEGDRDKASQFFAEDLEYHIGGATQVSGTRKGLDAVIGLRDELPDDLEPSFEMHDVLADDEHAVMLFWVHHEREGKAPLEAPGVWVAHVADTKITEIWAFPWDPAAVREFLS